MKQNKKGSNMMISLIAGVISFGVTLCINFFLSPFIVETVGTAAYGFVNLANNFITYASIITIAVNSMAGRFISIEIHRGNTEGANKYFSSIMSANLILSTIMLFLTVISVVYLDAILDIPIGLVGDVRLLFVFIFLNFVISTLFSTYSSATFIADRMDILYKRQIESNLIRVAILLISYTFFSSNVFYVGLATIISAVYVVMFNIYYMRKFFPEVTFKQKNIELKKIITVIKSGIWNSITNLGNVLLDGLDLLISNKFFTALAMGQVSLSKILCSSFKLLLSTISGIFTPRFVIDYANNDKDKLITDLKFSMKVTSILSNIFLSIAIALGFYFFQLWVPGEEIELIYKLSILGSISVILSGVVTPLWSVFTVTNKLRANSIITLITGFVSTLITIVLIKNTSYGLYAIVATSGIISIIRNIFVTPIHVSSVLKISKKTFYSPIFLNVFVSLILSALFYSIGKIVAPNSWLVLILLAFIFGIIGIIFNYFIMLNKNEKKLIKEMIFKKRV